MYFYSVSESTELTSGMQKDVNQESQTYINLLLPKSYVIEQLTLHTCAAVKAHPPYISITHALNNSQSSETWQYHVHPFYFCSPRTSFTMYSSSFSHFQLLHDNFTAFNQYQFYGPTERNGSSFSLGVILGAIVLLNFIKALILPFLKNKKKFSTIPLVQIPSKYCIKPTIPSRFDS